jgi:hypothetical protein
MRRFHTCKRCNERMPTSFFRTETTSYKAKDGSVTTYKYPRGICRYCESKKFQEYRISKELDTTETNHYKSGVRVNLRTVIDSVKRRMNKEHDPYLRLAYAQVGLELNNCLMRL